MTEAKKKWQADPNDPPGRIQVKRVNDALANISREHGMFVEKTGIIGVSEHESVLWALSIGASNSPREDVKAAQAALGEQFNWTVSRSNIKAIIAAVDAALPALKANRPITDKRETQEVRKQKDAEYAAIHSANEQEAAHRHRLFLAEYGSGEELTAQLGQMIVTAQLKYDNSDMMSDYFDSHASYGPKFALGVVSKQAETEALARRFARQYEPLAGVEFEWKTEKYSMGHGNYLEQKGGFELPEQLRGFRSRYGGGEVTHVGWEIEFSRAYNSQPITMPRLKGFSLVAAPDPIAPLPGEAATVTENREKNGIEIRFADKPSPDVLANLKANGWRWARGARCWYKRASEDALTFAQQFKATVNQPS